MIDSTQAKISSLAFCTKLSRLHYVCEHYQNFLPDSAREAIEQLANIRNRFKDLFLRTQSQAATHQLAFYRGNVSSGIGQCARNFTSLCLTRPFQLEDTDFIDRIERFLSVQRKREHKGYPLYEAGFLERYMQPGSTQDSWEPSINRGAHHFMEGIGNIISFDIPTVEQAHLHQIVKTHIHECLHLLGLTEEQIRLGSLDLEFLKENREICEHEGKRLLDIVLRSAKPFYNSVSSLSSNFEGDMQWVEDILLMAYNQWGFPLPPSAIKIAASNCDVCGKEYEVIFF